MTSDELKSARQELGLTQEQIGKSLGMQRQAYSLVENQRKPTKIHAAAIRMLVFIKEHGLIEEFIAKQGIRRKSK